MPFHTPLFLRVAALSLWLLAAPHSFAEIAAARLETGRAATAFVVAFFDKGGKSGTAFCIDSAGLFVTNHHVVTENNKAGKITVVVSPGTRAAKYLPATVIASDANLDLAILKVTGAGTLSALELAPPAYISRLRETEEVVALGFPLGFNLTIDPKAAPEISINTGKITALRHKDSSLMLIQFDGKMNHGNSGSPLLDSRGKVIGYVFAGKENEEINFAYPVTFLHYFLAKSQIVLTPRELLDPDAARVSVKEMNRPAPAGRKEIPSEPARKQAVKVIHEVFSKQYADRSQNGRSQLVLELLERLNSDKTDDPAARYVMLTEVRTTAIGLGDMYTALYASEILSEEYVLNEIELLTDVVTKPLAPGDASQQQAAIAATFSLLLVEAGAARHDYTQATKLISTTKSLAYRTRNPQVIKSVGERLKRIEAQKEEFDQGMLALQKLKDNPTDAAANLAAGRYHSLVLGDFPAAMPFFAKSADSTWTSIARAELAKPSKPDDQKSIGDLWWEQAAREKANQAANDACKARAAFWYSQCHAGLSGLSRTMIEQRVASVDALLLSAATAPAGKEAPKISKAHVVDLLDSTDTQRDTRASVWHLEKRGLSNEPAKAAELRFNYKPPPEYDLNFEYSLTSGEWGTCIILTHGDKVFLCSLPRPNTPTIWLPSPPGTKAEQFSAKLPASTANGCNVCVQVRNNRITVIVDEKKVINYLGDNWHTAAPSPAVAPEPVRLGVLVWWGRILVTKAQVTEIAGSASDGPSTGATPAKANP